MTVYFANMSVSAAYMATSAVDFIHKLPPKIISRVASYLDKVEGLASLRLVSKQIGLEATRAFTLGLVVYRIPAIAENIRNLTEFVSLPSLPLARKAARKLLLTPAIGVPLS